MGKGMVKMSKTNDNAWAEEIRTLLFRLNKSITTTIDYFPKGSFVSISKVCLNHLPLNHPKQTFMFAPYAASHTTYHVTSKDVDIIPIERIRAVLKSDIFLSHTVIEEGSIIHIQGIDHTNHRVFFKFNDVRVTAGLDVVTFAEKPEEKKENNIQPISIPTGTSNEISIEYIKTREKLLQGKTLMGHDYDILFDAHNSLRYFYQIFGDVKYKEQAESIMLLIKQK